METIILIMFFIASLPVISPTRTFPFMINTQSSLNQSFGLTLPIYHVRHPKMQMQIAKNLAFSPLLGADDKYLMEVNLGEPMVYALLVFDTGSDMSWIQQSLFKGSASRTRYRPDCGSHLCTLVPNYNCTETLACSFNMTYAGGRNVAGILDVEYFYLYSNEDEGAPSVKTETPIGLGVTEGFKSAGVVGMNFGTLGLLYAFDVEQFSVCFPNPRYSLRTRVMVGEDALLLGECVKIFRSTQHLMFHIDSLRVAGVTLSTISGKGSGEDVIFDTGSDLTYLNPVAMDAVLDTLRRNITQKEVHSLEFELCYRMTGNFTPFFDTEFAFQLGEGKELRLNFENIWKPSGYHKYCLNMKRSRADITIFGLAQMWGINFGFDGAEFLLCYENSDCL